MSNAPALENRYRRLLGWYPRSFRAEHDEEMLGVLMAGAREGQRRPSLVETADLLKGALWLRLLALGMRLMRAVRPGRENRRWADALVVFSVLAPLFLLAAELLEIAVPYHLPPRGIDVGQAGLPYQSQLGGLSLLDPWFGIAIGLQVIMAVLVLAGRRRLALAAVTACAGYGFAAIWNLIPEPLVVLGVTVYALEAIALAGSPGQREARSLVRWSHVALLVLAVAAVQVLTLMSDTRNSLAQTGQGFNGGRLFPLPSLGGYLVLIAVLAVAAAGVAAAVRMNRYFLLLAAAMCYPVVVLLAASVRYPAIDLIGIITPGHLAVLFLPPLLLVAAAMITARAGLRIRVIRVFPG